MSRAYDYLIVGSGLYGGVLANHLKKRGFRVLVVERRDHIGGNVYTEKVNGVLKHKYGAHIFHTSSEKVWSYITAFCKFNSFINEPLANYEGRLYNLPFNMNTFYQIWGTLTPKKAQEKIAEETKFYKNLDPQNLEEQALKLVGPSIYNLLIRGYTIKQWGTDPTNLPPEIIKRLPLRFVFNNNYFNDKYQGIPIGGYTQIAECMFDDVEVQLGVDFFSDRKLLESKAKHIIFTGPLDRFFEFRHGRLDYRSLRFEHESYNCSDFQGNAVVNYTSEKVPYTRIIEHKHFDLASNPTNCTLITKEFPASLEETGEPYYPINNQRNQKIYDMYRKDIESVPNVIFGGRLAEYRYYDMHQVIGAALAKINKLKL